MSSRAPMMRATSINHMQPYEKLNVFGYGLVALVTLIFAAVMPEVRAPMLAMCVGAAAQLPVWMSAPMSRSEPVPSALVALQGGLAVGSVVASVFASAWFVLPAVTTVMTTIGLVLARRVGPTASAQEATSEVPAEAPPSASASVEEFLALHPGLDRFGVVLRTSSLVLATMCVVTAAAEPGMLVVAACFAALAGAVRLAEWLSAKTMPPAALRDLERLRREREAAHRSGRTTQR
jgi:hypothetical protein